MRIRNVRREIVALAALVGPALIAGLVSSCGSSANSSDATGTNSSGSGGSGNGGSSATGTSTGGSGAGTGTGGTGAGPTACTGNSDCAGDPAGAVCDTATGKCVGCLPSSNTCQNGQFCDPATNTCVTGCASDADCANDPNGYLHCELGSQHCVACLTDDHCDLGTVCSPADGYVCVPGCTPTHDCLAGFKCCTDQCFDLMTDFDHCGACDTGCTNPANAQVTCAGGMCGMAVCNQFYADCDGSVMNGCEQNTLQDGSCVCVPNTTQSCYQGAPGTNNVGPCKSGTQTCAPSGTAWGPCVGQVLPKTEICANNIDDDCDGTKDNGQDLDGDGWTTCQGDCCDTIAKCANPKQVNPGAFEVPGNGVDDDCDGTIDNPVVACSTQAKFTAVTGTDVANAMDICQTTTANPPLASKKWGLISALQIAADGSVFNATDLANVRNWQTAILTGYGTNNGNKPKKFLTMAGMSTGQMRDEGDPNFNNIQPTIFSGPTPNEGSDFSRSIQFSPVPGVATPIGFYLSKHGNNLLPGACGNVTCSTGTSANDSMDVRLSIRVPTNALSFSYDFKFFSAEYQTYQCTAFNDYFLAMLTSGAAGIPNDHNISFDSLNHPVSVNNGFFQICPGNGKNCGPCPNGVAELAGTSMEIGSTGGATTWLTTDSPVVPGETIQLELLLFDVSDGILDSVVLLDNFRWGLQPAVVNTHM